MEESLKEVKELVRVAIVEEKKAAPVCSIRFGPKIAELNDKEKKIAELKKAAEASLREVMRRRLELVSEEIVVEESVAEELVVAPVTVHEVILFYE